VIDLSFLNSIANANQPQFQASADPTTGLKGFNAMAIPAQAAQPAGAPTTSPVTLNPDGTITPNGAQGGAAQADVINQLTNAQNPYIQAAQAARDKAFAMQQAAYQIPNPHLIPLVNKGQSLGLLLAGLLASKMGAGPGAIAQGLQGFMGGRETLQQQQFAQDTADTNLQRQQQMVGAQQQEQVAEQNMGRAGAIQQWAQFQSNLANQKDIEGLKAQAQVMAANIHAGALKDVAGIRLDGQAFKSMMSIIGNPDTDPQLRSNLATIARYAFPQWANYSDDQISQMAQSYSPKQAMELGRANQADAKADQINDTTDALKQEILSKAGVNTQRADWFAKRNQWMDPMNAVAIAKGYAQIDNLHDQMAYRGVQATIDAAKADKQGWAQSQQAIDTGLRTLSQQINKNEGDINSQRILLTQTTDKAEKQAIVQQIGLLEARRNDLSAQFADLKNQADQARAMLQSGSVTGAANQAIGQYQQRKAGRGRGPRPGVSIAPMPQGASFGQPTFGG
jgi:hypothetical protein